MRWKTTRRSRCVDMYERSFALNSSAIATDDGVEAEVQDSWYVASGLCARVAHVYAMHTHSSTAGIHFSGRRFHRFLNCGVSPTQVYAQHFHDW
jgi:hypothetical protein